MDDELAAKFNGKEWVSFEKPGYRLEIIQPKIQKEFSVLCKIWGCCLILTPQRRPISEEANLELEWPDYSGIMTYDRARASSMLDYVYVADEIMGFYEGRPEFEVDPLAGSISYDGQWSLGYSHRIGRDYIAYELKKVYEGCSPSIIQYVHKFSVEKTVAKANQQKFGDQNIGMRAEALIEAFLDLGDAFSGLAEKLLLPFEGEDIISLERELVEYKGWWRVASLKPLGYRSPRDMIKNQFLERCKTIQQLIEGLREKALRRIVDVIGLSANDTSKLKTLKLMATILQLCKIASESGLDINEQRSDIVARWDKDIRLSTLPPFFALIDLRNAAGHNLGSGEADKVRQALKTFEINESSTINGWGLALDTVYETLTANMIDIANLVREVTVDCE